MWANANGERFQNSISAIRYGTEGLGSGSSDREILASPDWDFLGNLTV